MTATLDMVDTEYALFIRRNGGRKRVNGPSYQSLKSLVTVAEAVLRATELRGEPENGGVA